MPDEMRWWGWGDPRHPASLSPRALAFLRERLGMEGPPSSPRGRSSPPGPPSPALASLRERLGMEGSPPAPRPRSSPPGPPSPALASLRERLGMEGQPSSPRGRSSPPGPPLPSSPRPPVALERVRLESSVLGEQALDVLRAAVGAEHVRTDRRARILHAAGKGYPDLVRLRAGEPQGAPDAVAYPASPEQLRALLDACAQQSVAVVPFGGGTSVVGGLAPLCGAHRGVLSLDMRRMSALLALDEHSRTVTVQAGMRVRSLERALSEKGLTLGHFPQSFEYVSLGGCAATRSAGQASNGYGRFDQMVLGLSLCAPSGPLGTSAVPASAAGPDLRQLILGSEGTLGVIDRLTLRVRPAPPERIYEGVFFHSFHDGLEAFRELAQAGAAPDIARLSDEPETHVSLGMARHGGTAEQLGRAWLRARGYSHGCLAILGFEGQPEELRRRRRRAHAVVRAHSGLLAGRSPGRAWLASRFSAPYLRDELLTHRLIVETLETATSWSGLARLREEIASAVSGALRELGTPGLVGCHVSHLYSTGASLYFTVLAPQLPGREIEQWQAVKHAAACAIAHGGGTISHHHGVGRDHAAHMPEEIGREGVAALLALKRQLDPHGMMNPGKLLGGRD